MMRTIRSIGMLFIIFIFSTNTSLAASDDTTIKNLVDQSVAVESKGDFTAAIEIHKKIIALQPYNYEAMNNIAGLYGKLKKYEDEITWAKKSIALNAKYVAAYINLGNGYFCLEQLSDAEKAYRIALSLDPKSAMIYYNLGLVADEIKDFTAAVGYYEKANQLNPGSEDILTNLAIAYANNREIENTVKTLHILLAKYPNSEDGKILLMHFTPKGGIPAPKESTGHSGGHGH